MSRIRPEITFSFGPLYLIGFCTSLAGPLGNWLIGLTVACGVLLAIELIPEAQ